MPSYSGNKMTDNSGSAGIAPVSQDWKWVSR